MNFHCSMPLRIKLILQFFWLKHAALRDHSGDEFRWCHIERRIPNADPWRGNSLASNVRHFVLGPFLDDDGVAGGPRRIDAGEGRTDVEGDVVLRRETRDLISSDFVGGVAVDGHAVRSNEHRLDVLLLKKVGNLRGENLVNCQEITKF